MSELLRPAWLRTYVLLVGAMDTVTGVLLVVAPALVLKLMFVTRFPAELVWLRFIGAFVTGVGLIYVYPFLIGGERFGARLRGALEATAIVRGAVGLVVAACVARGALDAAWLTVAVTDLSLAVFQAFVLRRGTSVGERA